MNRDPKERILAALSELSVSLDQSKFHQVFAMLAFNGDTLFRDVSPPVPQATRRKIAEFDGPRFFFVGHTSHFDYVLATQLIRRLGIAPPVTQVAGSLTRGWMSNWLKGFRSLHIPKILSPFQHRAYSWFSALWRKQVRIRRSSLEQVGTRSDPEMASCAKPYVPHGVLAGVKATGKALVGTRAVSIPAIPKTDI